LKCAVDYGLVRQEMVQAAVKEGGLHPDFGKRGAIRSVFDGRYQFTRHFLPKQHNRLTSLEAPGGYIGIHSHKDRPAVVYCLQGTDTVTLDSGAVTVLHPGDASSASKNTTHWHRNDGKEPVVLIAVDVFHNAK
jgi:quercetin dioxygenase-like cupin family protein